VPGVLRRVEGVFFVVFLTIALYRGAGLGQSPAPKGLVVLPAGVVGVVSQILLRSMALGNLLCKRQGTTIGPHGLRRTADALFPPRSGRTFRSQGAPKDGPL